MGVSMRETLLLVFVLQTIIATCQSVTLPIPNAIGTVTSIKPRPLLPSSVPEVLPTIKSLEWDEEDIISPLFSSLGVSREFSSPIVLTTSSKALPVPKIENLSVSDVKIPEGCEDSLPASIKTLLKGTPVVQINSDVCSTEILFPFKRLVKDKIKLPKIYDNVPEIVKPRCDDMCLSSSISEVSIKANPFGHEKSKFSSVNPNHFVPNIMLLPKIKSPSAVSIDLLKKHNFESTIPKYVNNGLSTVTNSLPNYSKPSLGVCTSGVVPEPPVLKPTVPPISEIPTSSLSPSFTTSLPHPLSYKSQFLPRVRTPEFRNWRSPYIPNGNLNIHNLSNPPNLINPTPPLPFHLNSFNERKLFPELTCSPQSAKKLTCESVPPCLNSITMTERPNFFDAVQIPKITPPLDKNPWQYKKPFTSSVGCENIGHPNSFKTVDTICTDSILPIFHSIPFVTVDDISYSYQNGLPSVTPKTTCKSTLVLPTDVFCSNSPSTPIPCIKENHPKIKTTPIISLDESPNSKTNFDSNICSSVFSIPNMFPTVDAFVDSLNNLGSTSRTKDISSCTTSVPPDTPSNNCCTKIYQSSDLPITSYINISPSYPMSQSCSKIVSSINDMVANITQNLLTSYISYLKSEPKPVCKKPKCAPKNNPNIPDLRPKVTPIRSSLPPVNLSYEKSPVPIVCPTTNTNYCPQSDCPVIIQLDPLFSANTLTFVSQSPQTSQLLSLIDNSSPLSPSYLPSPTLPYTSSPFYAEAPVLKLSSSKSKKEKDRVLELMVLSELLDGDDNYEWDELDTLLALLAIS